ncbi:MAG: Uncharacterised protein [Flavobacteriaceae bacterium]|nr:MAG: Uncharacterised protein [Flavobacteriaceae bacterium]
MPFTVKKDILPNGKFGLKGSPFSLRKMKKFRGGSVVNHVKEKIADKNYKDFHNSWAFDNPRRNILLSLAKKFNLNDRVNVFKKLWEITRASNRYKSRIKEEVDKDLKLSYERIARIANGESVDRISFSRKTERSDDNFVIFSDLHMTNLNQLPNYFKDNNYKLYLQVLDQYAQTNYCLVENGDVEECIIYDVSIEEAKNRKKAMGDFPIENNEEWNDFLKFRYRKRMETLNHIIDSFPDYYRTVKHAFIAKDKYVRLTGNHDTYSDEPFERDLRDRIEEELDTSIHDVLSIKRNGDIKYVVLHGHQFDSVSQLHGNIPWAKSFGEIYSENVSWAFQGPDRVWEFENEGKKWFVGNSYENKLARETPGKFGDGPNDETDKNKGLNNSLVFGGKTAIKKDSKDFFEALLDHEIAWEYFENNSDDSEAGYLSIALEVLTGDEMFKFRHMNEIDLCKEYEKCFNQLSDGKKEAPTLVLGHTHEPRQNATWIEDNSMQTCDFYLNSGSAGRYENLIWCVEIRGNKDYIVSWSRTSDGMLRKTTWRSFKDRLTYYPDDVITINPFIQLMDTLF